MGKIGLMAAALVLAGWTAAATAADSPFRVDVSGVGSKVKLAGVKAAGQIETKNQPWGKEEDRPFTLTGAASKPPAEWTDYTFGLTAENDGPVTVAFLAQWAKETADRGWLLLCDIRLEGAELENGDLAKVEKGAPVGFRYIGKGMSVAAGAGEDGANAVAVNHDNRLAMTLKAEAGKTYTFHVKAKVATPPGK